MKFNEWYLTLSVTRRYALAILIYLIALLLPFVLFSIDLAPSFPAFLTFSPAVLITFVLCGKKPGVLVIILSAVAGLYISTPPYHSFETEKGGLIVLATFIFSECLIGLVVTRMQGYQSQLTFIINEKGKQAAELLIVNKELSIAATAFQSQEGIMVTDANTVMVRVNQSYTRITGYSAEDAIGQAPQLISSGKHSKEFYAEMWKDINNTGSWEGEIWNRRKNGEIYPCYLTITAVKNMAGNTTNYVGAFNDITSSKAASEEIKNLAFYDPLTHLPNRRLLLDRLNYA